MPSPRSFAECLRQAMALRGFNQTALGKAIGRQQRTVSGWCSGETQPNAADVAACSDALHVSADFLVGRVDHPSGLVPGDWILDEDLLALARQDRKAVVIPGQRIPRRPLLVDDQEAQRLWREIEKERRKK